MGMLDNALLQQAKKGQGETNARLDALIAEQRQTNALLLQVVQLLTVQQGGQQQVVPQAPLRVSWGTQQG